MTHIVTDACVRCKYTDCVEVCPVDCFHEGEMMLVINPDECIDCGVCIPWCPADAIKVDTEPFPDLIKWLAINKKHSAEWPVLNTIKPALPNADNHVDEKNKYEKYITKNIKN
jgi:ferredoxin